MRPIIFKLQLTFVLLLPLLVGCTQTDPNTLSVSGLIEGINVDAGSRIGGRVAEVLVKEGDPVAKDAILVRIESSEAESLVAASQAQLAQAQATLDKLETGARAEQIAQAEALAAQAKAQYDMALKGARSQEIEAARATVDAAKAARDEAAIGFNRARKLLPSGAISEQHSDVADRALKTAQAQLKAAEEKLGALVEGSRSEEIMMAKAAYERSAAALEELKNGARTEDIAAARAVRDSAKAALALSQVQLDEMTIKAPMDGVVDSIDVHPGDLVKPGRIVRIVDPDNLELTVYVGAAALGHLRLSQRITLTTDSHGAETFEAEIVHIASEGEFTPRNLQTQEERVQQVFQVKLKLDSTDGKLRAGMTATAHLDLRQGTN